MLLNKVFSVENRNSNFATISFSQTSGWKKEIDEEFNNSCPESVVTQLIFRHRTWNTHLDAIEAHLKKCDER